MPPSPGPGPDISGLRSLLQIDIYPIMKCPHWIIFSAILDIEQLRHRLDLAHWHRIQADD